MTDPRYLKRRRLLIERGQWRGLLPAVGTSRRLRALARNGWSWAALCEESGMEKRCLQRLAALERPTVHPATYDRIADLFDRLALVEGPSRRTAQYAARHGWPPPLAWDDDAIDDPAGKPWKPEPRRRQQPCGTVAAARRHRRRGEPRCDDCLLAERRDNAARERARSAA